MRVLKARAALLSDYEVLQLIRENEAEQRNDARNRKEQLDTDMDVPSNLRTMQFEMISALSQPYRPCAFQRAEQIRAFLDDLNARGYVIPDDRVLAGEPGLTKTERLQLVNHAPSSVVELHTLAEELGQRMSDDQIAEILQCVTTNLPITDAAVTMADSAVTETDADTGAGAASHQMEEESHAIDEDMTMNEAEMEAAEDAFPEEEFEHEEPGAGMDQDGGEDD